MSSPRAARGRVEPRRGAHRVAARPFRWANRRRDGGERCCARLEGRPSSPLTSAVGLEVDAHVFRARSRVEHKAPDARFARTGRTSGRRCSKDAALPAVVLASSCWLASWSQPPLEGIEGLIVAFHRLSAPAWERLAPWTRGPPTRNPDASRFLAAVASPAGVSETGAGVRGALRDPSPSPGSAAPPAVAVAPGPARCTPDRSTRSRGRTCGRSPPAGDSPDSRTAFLHGLRLLGLSRR